MHPLSYLQVCDTPWCQHVRRGPQPQLAILVAAKREQLTTLSTDQGVRVATRNLQQAKKQPKQWGETTPTELEKIGYYTGASVSRCVQI
jgi:hypothetical protein